MKRLLGALAGVSSALLFCPVPGTAQSAETRTVVPSERYHAGPVKRLVLGDGWRDIWATPMAAPVLNLSTYAGGLTPTKKGGNQSATLRFAGKDGRTYIFRSMDKFLDKALGDDLAHTKAGDVAQDQTSTMHPTAPLMASRFEEMVGVLQARPHVVIMPDDPRLGEFRKQFANMVGTIEERPDEAKDGMKLFGGADKIVATDKFAGDLEEKLTHRLDAREYLKARLIDFLVGDTDRGADQWRWARYDRGDEHVFRPIPRDHDYAFIHASGLLATIVKRTFPKLVSVGNEFPPIKSLTFMTRDFDRTELSELPWSAWDSVVTSVQSTLTDAAIQAAFNTIPPEHHPGSADRIISGLRGRRQLLPQVAREFYALVNDQADVFATDENELAIIERQNDGSVNIAIYREQRSTTTDDGDTPSGAVWQRRFLPNETREVRVYLQGGDDRAIVRGSARNRMSVRVTGGAGDDLLMDSVTSASGKTFFYDATGANQFVAGNNTRIDERPYVTVQPMDAEDDGTTVKASRIGLAEERRGRFQDEVNVNSKDFVRKKTTNAFQRTDGSTFGFRPALDYRVGAGVIVGAGPTYTNFGFRRVPVEWAGAITPMIATATGGLGVQASYTVFPENSKRNYSLLARASTFEALIFNGFGNNTRQLDQDISLVRRNEIDLIPSVNWMVRESNVISVGPILRYTDPRPAERTPARSVRDDAGFGQVGARADVKFGLHDQGIFVRQGARVFAGGSAYPALWSVESAFGEAHVEGNVYVPLWRPVLALRAGGKRVWGDDFPLHDAAFVGGRTTLRGFEWNRFTGDTEAHGTAELRVPLGRAELFFRGDVGVFAFTDVGRVWFHGNSAGGWHDSQGGGVWFATLGQAVSLMYGKGEEGRFYIQFGLPF